MVTCHPSRITCNLLKSYMQHCNTGYACWVNGTNALCVCGRSSGLSGGAIAGIVIGVLAAIALAVFIAFFAFRRRREPMMPKMNGGTFGMPHFSDGEFGRSASDPSSK